MYLEGIVEEDVDCFSLLQDEEMAVLTFPVPRNNWCFFTSLETISVSE